MDRKLQSQVTVGCCLSGTKLMLTFLKFGVPKKWANLSASKCFDQRDGFIPSLAAEILISAKSNKVNVVIYEIASITTTILKLPWGDQKYIGRGAASYCTATRTK